MSGDERRYHKNNCHATGCKRVGTHHAVLNIWPMGAGMALRPIRVNLNVLLCGRCQKKASVGEMLTEAVRVAVDDAFRTSGHRPPDYERAQLAWAKPKRGKT